MYSDDKVAPQTTEPHFTDPIEKERTTHNVERYTHRVPLDWFLVASGRIDAWTYEHYIENEQLFEANADDYSAEAVEFDYEREPNPDGTGKPFRVLLVAPEEDETKCYSRTHYLLWLLDYDEDTFEVVSITPADDRDAVLVMVQERLPHIPEK